MAESLELVNLTPHEIRVLDADFVVGPVSGQDLLRTQKSSLLQGSVMDSSIFLMVEEIYGVVPQKRDGVLYIVSKRVADALARDCKFRDRHDFIYPIHIEHTYTSEPLMDAYGEEVKDSKGETIMKKQQQIKGCRGFEFPRRDDA